VIGTDGLLNVDGLLLGGGGELVGGGGGGVDGTNQDYNK
jgi:hypothetical protein